MNPSGFGRVRWVKLSRAHLAALVGKYHPSPLMGLAVLDGHTQRRGYQTQGGPISSNDQPTTRPGIPCTCRVGCSVKGSDMQLPLHPAIQVFMPLLLLILSFGLPLVWGFRCPDIGTAQRAGPQPVPGLQQPPGTHRSMEPRDAPHNMSSGNLQCGPSQQEPSPQPRDRTASPGVRTVRLGSDLGKHRLERVNAFANCSSLLTSCSLGMEGFSSEQSDEHATNATERRTPRSPRQTIQRHPTGPVCSSVPEGPGSIRLRDQQDAQDKESGWPIS